MMVVMVDPPTGGEPSEPVEAPVVIDLEALDTLVGMLAASGHRVHAPVVARRGDRVG